MKTVMVGMCCVALAGCASFQEPTSNAQQITLSQALKEVRRGIYEMQGSQSECLKELGGEAGSGVIGTGYVSTEQVDRCRKAGLLVREVEVTFNITGLDKRTAGQELGIDPSNLMVEFPSAKLTRNTENSETRGNIIRFKFENVYLAPSTSLIGMDVQRRIEQLQKAPPASGTTPVATSPIDDAINGIGGAQIIHAQRMEQQSRNIEMARDPKQDAKKETVR
ncbi:hypothetical protein [Pseudoxanthomonas winnipegensis]|uniref:hypothetical protein n=1 Tax=Pseudoxanthomonas winnipegensis TaxID=2480810 RepID=UPI001039C537|nr:hypothetical protein [Pseudoxanthomonas winnipegensis]TBV69765.1 hypothetical protein EYC45_19140 [Pseudoxanthomonas winnipegensis]